ncbi:MAG: Crp/Fnr family transcriptional regulator [Geobacter sp.]|nr:Crp/Fnr family transcriptional regulator [Geobacter sp.]
MIRTRFNRDKVLSLLKKVPLFANFSDAEIYALLERTNAYSCQRGETIFLEDEEDRFMYVILGGRLKVVEITREGQERVMAIRHRGDYFGDMGILDGKTDFATVIAMEDSKVLLLTKSLFDEFLLENVMVMQGIITELCRRLRECWLFHTIIGTNDAESKIRVTLARFGKTLGVPNSNGVIINAPFTHQALADRVQVSRETVTRMLKKMKNNGEIEMVEGRRIKLLPKFFQEIARCELYLALSGDS